MTKSWQNKIIGHDEVPPEQLLAHPENWRIHPRFQQEALRGVINDIGFIKSVTVNQRTGRVIDGHLRVTLALRDSIPLIPVEYVDLTEAEEAEALLTIDPIAALAGSDKANLEALLAQVKTDDDSVMKLLEDTATGAGVFTELDDNYSRKIEAPIYTPKGDKPAIVDMVDETRTKELYAEIEAANIPEDEKNFLRIAANRHTVLNFKRIAEYYAHSPAPVQRLMENSALVIIDFKRAIELGYVKLSEEIAAQYLKDYPNAG